MSAHLVRFLDVAFTSPDGELVHAHRGQTVDLNAADAERLTALGAVVPPGTDLRPPTDDRPWEQVLQEIADARYDRAMP